MAKTQRKGMKRMRGGGAKSDLAKERTAVYAELGNDESIKAKAKQLGEIMYEDWFAKRTADGSIPKIQALFQDDGTPAGPVSATAFNDLYKWTMMPVIREFERLKCGSDPNKRITVRFGIDIRDKPIRDDLKASAELRQQVLSALIKLKDRTFDRRMFEKVNAYFKGKPGADQKSFLNDATTINSIFSEGGKIRSLVQDVLGTGDMETPETPVPTLENGVTICFYYNPNVYYDQTKQDESIGLHFIEATGPWHKVTWLETSMMQCVYETYYRFKKGIKDKESYKNWLQGSLKRCAKSVAYTQLMQQQALKKGVPPFVPALFTGRRTGGLQFIMLQNMFFADHFKQFGTNAKADNSIFDTLSYPYTLTNQLNTEYKTSWNKKTILDKKDYVCLGTSSVDSWVKLKELGLPCLNPAGTHAHELSMVGSVLFPFLDNSAQFQPKRADETLELLPLTQVLGHYLYYTKVLPKTGAVDVPTNPMPMLPDTLGTRAFMKAASYVQLQGRPFLEKILSARQDSGTLKDFADNMDDFKYDKSMMASEIEYTKDLFNAASLGYTNFGAGGFYGDSAKVWDDPDLVSMAVKAVKVMYNEPDDRLISEYVNNTQKYCYITVTEKNKITGYPVKTGDPKGRTDEAANTIEKLSLDKNMDTSLLKQIKDRVLLVRSNAQSKDLTDQNKPTIRIEDIMTAIDKHLTKGGTRKRRMMGRKQKTCRR